MHPEMVHIVRHLAARRVQFERKDFKTAILPLPVVKELKAHGGCQAA